MRSGTMFLFTVIIAIFVVQIDASSCPSRSEVITLEDIQIAARASKSVYKETFVEGKELPDTDFKVTNVFHGYPESGGVGIKVAMLESGDTIIVAYRGTVGKMQLFKEAISKFRHEEKMTIDGTETEVLKYFYRAFRLCFDDLKAQLKNPDKRYIFTGHSLGGALASILALEMTQHYGNSVWQNPKSCMITFGQPRVGNKAYADVHDRMVPTFRKLRFRYRSDPVTRIPDRLSGWTHHSRVVYIGTYKKWKKKREFVPTDNIIDDDDKGSKKGLLWTNIPYWQVCGEQEDSKCTSGYTVPILSHHDMDNYLKQVMNPPELFKTSQGRPKISFEAALLGSCNDVRR